ncbi:MAG: T9SS type A sorting domain-containing protein [Bacteroidota bacterium]
MKNSLLLLFIVQSLVVGQAQAQWQPDVRLTNNLATSTTSLNNAWCVAAMGDTVQVVWDDDRDGNTEIYYKRSTDAGVNWGTDTRLTNNVDESLDPCIALSGSDVHIVWQNAANGHYAIYYKRSTNGGVSWLADTSLTNVPFDLWNPSIAVNGSGLHVVWEDERQGNSEIYYKGSTDGGAHWGTDIRLTNNGSDSWNPAVSVSGSDVHVVWYDNRDGNWEIYYKHSSDAGVSWGPEVRLTNNAGVSRYPCIAVSGSVVHVVWHDDRGGNLQPYYKRSADGGVNWGPDTPLSTNLGGSYYPCVAVSASRVHVVWYDFRDGNYELYYKISADGGTSWGPDTRLTYDPAYSFFPSIAVSGPVVHVVWQDMRDGNYEIYYKRDPTGNAVGITEIPDENMFQVFPNPASNEVNVQSSDKINEILIYDVYGREVYRQEIVQTNTEYHVTTSGFSNGIYFIKLTAKDRSCTRKFVKI